MNETFHAGRFIHFIRRVVGEYAIVLGQLLGDSLMTYRYTFVVFPF